MNTSSIVQKLWNSACLLSVGADKHCNVLRDDGMSYGDYVEAAPALSSLRRPCSARKPGLGFLPRPLDGATVHWTVALFPSRPCARGIRTSCSAQLTFALTLALSQRERGKEGRMADEPVCVRTRTGRRTKAPYLPARSAQAGNQKSLPAPDGAQVNPVPEKLVCASNDAGRYSWLPSPWPSPASGRGGFGIDGDELFDHCRKLANASVL
jgi:hypothetical protein